MTSRLANENLSGAQPNGFSLAAYKANLSPSHEATPTTQRGARPRLQWQAGDRLLQLEQQPLQLQVLCQLVGPLLWRKWGWVGLGGGLPDNMLLNLRDHRITGFFATPRGREGLRGACP